MIAGSKTHVRPHGQANCAEFDEFSPDDRLAMGSVMVAVVAELGLGKAAAAERKAIASGIATSWRGGARMPLNLVHAGLNAIRP